MKIENINIEVKAYKQYNELKEIHSKGGTILVENTNYLAKVTSETKRYNANLLTKAPFYKAKSFKTHCTKKR